MKPTLKARPSHRLADRARGLAPAERAELQRQGAKAAARGDGSAENPMDDRSNQPATTGETDGLWQERKNAWNSGHEAQIKVDDKTGEGGEFRSAKDEH
ncbi:hypothetical protein OU995_15530 [Roseateles sp. SL47]|jgi:hypothetical protein|uniref:CrpP-related protein n=1 Tax=Roseateles sp. SL47 TaxID=2995138 RepID=UPI00226FA29B|nr:CrpP-related protein [Roseateles sp. SL47]WAC71018.1 hypothetical protein OU995_15530 [Roseateles sp. SL47]